MGSHSELILAYGAMLGYEGLDEDEWIMLLPEPHYEFPSLIQSIHQCERTIEITGATVYALTWATQPYNRGPIAEGETWQQVARTPIGTLPSEGEEIWPTQHPTDVVVRAGGTSYLVRIIDNVATIVETLGAESWIFFDAGLTYGVQVDSSVQPKFARPIVGRTVTGSPQPVASEIIGYVADRLWTYEPFTNNLVIYDPSDQSTVTVNCDFDIYEHEGDLGWQYVLVPDGDKVAVFNWGFATYQVDHFFRNNIWTVFRRDVLPDGTMLDFEYIDGVDETIDVNTATDFEFTAIPLHAVGGFSAVFADRREAIGGAT